MDELTKEDLELILQGLRKLQVKDEKLIPIIEKISRMRYHYSSVKDNTL